MITFKHRSITLLHPQHNLNDNSGKNIIVINLRVIWQMIEILKTNQNTSGFTGWHVHNLLNAYTT